MSSLGLRDLGCVYHPAVRADGRAVHGWTNGLSVSVTKRPCVPGSFVGLNSEMHRFRSSYLWRILRPELHADVISRRRDRDGAQCEEDDLTRKKIIVGITAKRPSCLLKCPIGSRMANF